MHALVLIAWQGFLCLDQNCYLYRSTFVTVWTALSAFCALLFGLFVVIMFVDQIQCIWGNTSTIDSLKLKNNKANPDDDVRGQVASTRSGWDNVKEVFGGDGIGFDWLLPTDLRRKLVVEKEYD